MNRKRTAVLSAIAAIAVSCMTFAQAPGGSEPANSSRTQEKPNATVSQPRAFGYVVGDVLTQRVLLSLNDRDFEPAELPSAGRVGVWFERRAARITRDDQRRRWLSVDYQLMNSPQALTVVTLPAWKIKSADAAAGELRVGEWPISVSPLTPERPATRPGLGSLQPDRTAPLIALAPIQRTFGIAVAGFLLTAFAWAAWFLWRNWRASSSQPFARAMREMRAMDGTTPEAWRALHRAFDATAGRAVRPETLPDVFRRAPQLVPLRAQIEEFFRQSAARFFAGTPITAPVSALTLCRELRRIEKRHER